MNIKKDKVVANLKRFPYASRVFKQAIEKRLCLEDFFENPLILELYEDHPRISSIDEILSHISASKAFDITELRKVLDGKDKNFDFKVFDFFSLLYGIKYFIDKDASDINIADTNKIKRMSEKKPDLRMNIRGKETYAEIKNVNEEDKLLTVISAWLRAKSILNPRHYSKLFVIDARTSSVDFDIQNYNRLKQIRIEFAQKFEVELSKAISNFRFEIDDMYFNVKQKPSERCDIIFSSESLGTKTAIINVSDEFLCTGRMYYKALKKLYEAFLQLLSNRRGEFEQVKDDFIYLHFMGLGSRKMFYEDSIRKKFQGLVSSLDINNIVNIATNLFAE